MPTYTKLVGFQNADDDSVINTLQENLMDFFNWGLLEAGAYDDNIIDNSELGVNDPNRSVNLLPVTQPGVVDGSIWQAQYRNWVWETNLESDRQPIPISGVYVNGTFHTSSSVGQFQHYVNYPEGRVVFNLPIDTSSVVQVNYSNRWYNFYDEDVPWFRQVIFDLFTVDQDQSKPSGVLNLLRDNQVQLPAIVIESVPTRQIIPRQLGDLSQHIRQDFLFHILTDRSDDRNQLVDIIMLQKDRAIMLYDVNAKKQAGEFALSWLGAKIPGAKMYPQLVDLPPTGYRFNSCYFQHISSQETTAPLPLFRAVVRATLQMEFTQL